MRMCEKCWGDAYRLSIDSNKDQAFLYYKLLRERENKPCSKKQQAGQFWDEENQKDCRD